MTIIKKQNITNTKYEDLDPYWQNDNKLASEFIMDKVIGIYKQNRLNFDKDVIEKIAVNV